MLGPVGGGMLKNHFPPMLLAGDWSCPATVPASPGPVYTAALSPTSTGTKKRDSSGLQRPIMTTSHLRR